MRKVLAVVLCLAAWTVGCGGGNGPTMPTPDQTPSNPAVTVTCNGSSSACNIAFNASATIGWSSSNAQSCLGNWAGAVAATSGTFNTGALTAGRDFEVTCTNSAGTTARASIRVNVATAPTTKPGTFNVTASCTTIDSTFQRANLTWTQASGASNFRLEHRQWSTGAWTSAGTVTVQSFAETVRNDADYYYRVTAINSAGETLGTPNETKACTSVVPPPPPPPTGPASISIDFIPPWMSTQDLRGSVKNAVPSNHKVVVYIEVAGRWWIKPTDISPLTTIAANGTWVSDVTTGGNDTLATQFAAFLVTNNHKPVIALGTLSVPISVNGADVLDRVIVSRSATPSGK